MGSLRFGYVGHMDHGVFEAVAVEGFAAGTFHQGTRFLRRQLLTGFPQRIFPRGSISLIEPCLKISLGAFRQEHPPFAFEIGAGLVEGRGGVGLMFTRTRSRIEAAAPFPPISNVRVADALGDRTAVSD
jgi:hypothetical protein